MVFFVLSDWAEVVYKATDYYAPEFERSILWNDANINIEWPIQPGQKPIVSDKDIKAMDFRNAEFYN